MSLEISYNTGWDDTRGFSGNTWVAQTFTTIGAFVVEKVSFLLFNPVADILTVSLYATDGSGNPTGAALTSGTTDASTIAGFPGEWREITFDTTYALEAATKYALVLTIPSAGPLYFQDTSGAYAEGARNLSANAGVSWLGEDAGDLMFEIYSLDIPAPTKATDPIPSNNGTDVLLNTNLSWTKEATATSIVYLDIKSENNPPVTKVVDDEDVESYNPASDLEPETTYVWRVDTKNLAGTTTGDQWEFTTRSSETVLSFERGQSGINLGIGRGII